MAAHSIEMIGIERVLANKDRSDLEQSRNEPAPCRYDEESEGPRADLRASSKCRARRVGLLEYRISTGHFFPCGSVISAVKKRSLATGPRCGTDSHRRLHRDRRRARCQAGRKGLRRSSEGHWRAPSRSEEDRHEQARAAMASDLFVATGRHRRRDLLGRLEMVGSASRSQGTRGHSEGDPGRPAGSCRAEARRRPVPKARLG